MNVTYAVYNVPMCTVISPPHSPHALSSYMQREDRASLSPVETKMTVFCQQL